MSDLFDVFVFDLQRFADKSELYGSIEGYSSTTETGKYYWKRARDFYIFDEDGKATVNAANATITFSLSGTQYVDQVTGLTPAAGTYGFMLRDGSASRGSLNFTSADGKLSFGMSGVTPQSVYFMDVGDALVLNGLGEEFSDRGEAINFTDKYNFAEIFSEEFTLQDIAPSDKKSLELTSSNGDFALNGLSAGDGITFVEDLSVLFSGENGIDGGPSYLGSATAGGTIEFNLRKDLSITVDEGGIAEVANYAVSAGIHNANGVSVNGMAVDIDTTGFVYDNLSAEKPIIYFTDVDFGSGSAALEGNVLNLSVGGINASVKGMSEDYSGFILNANQEAQGFIFASSDSAITLIFGDGEIPEGFLIYNGYENSEDDVAATIPQVSGSEIAAIKKTTDSSGIAQLALIVDDGAIITDANGTSMTVDGAGASFVAIVFDPETGNIEGVMPAADPQGSDDDPADFNSGLTIKVSTAASTYESLNGLYFGGASTYGSASSFVAIGSGKFTYEKGSTIITLANSDDTVFALDNATKLKVLGGSGTVVDATDGDGDASNDATYSYNSAEGNAYFSLKPNAKDVTIILNTDPVTGEQETLEGKVSEIEGYVFVNEGDALNINGSTSIAVMYENESGSAVAVAETPIVVGASSYTVEMTAPYSTPINGGASVANFAVNNFSASNTGVQFSGGSFVFGTTEDEFLFDSNGGAVGFNASDTVAMDAGAAKFLDGTKGGSFLINDEDVNIVATGDGLLYDADDNDEQSLYGLSSGSEIVDAGGITKVYASKGEGEFVIGGTTYAFNAAGASAAERAYFNVDGADAKGFTFVVEDDALKVTSSMPEEFALTDADTETEINAPLAYEDDSKATVLDEYVITKGASSMYKMSGFSTGNYVEIETANSTASVTMADVSSSAAVVYDMNTQALAGFAELEDGNKIKVAGVSTAVDFDVDNDGDDTVEIAGDNVSYTYTYGTSAALDDVNADVTIKQVGGASYVGTASGVNGIGEYIFAAGASVQTFGVSNYQPGSTDIDGVKFMLGADSTVTAINDLDDDEYVAGYFADFADVKINGQSFAVEGGSGLFISVQGAANAQGANSIYLQEMKDSERVVVKATAGASTVLAADIEEIAFGTASAFTIAGIGSESGLTTGIKLTLNGLSVVDISDVDVQESISGYFDGVASVNGVSFAVDDANEIMIVGNEKKDGLTKIAKVSDGAEIENVGGASEVVTDTEGEFYFAGSSTFSVTGDNSVVFQMVDGEDAQVAGVSYFAVDGESATLSGMLKGLTINNSSASIVIDGDTDEVFDYMVDADGNATLGGVGNENGDVVTITETAGASFVQTNAKGTFVFASGQSFFTDDDSLTFKLNADGEVTEIYGLDKGNFVKGSFSTVVAVEGDTSLQSVQVEGDSSVTVYHGSLILDEISNLATIQTADGIVEAWTDPIAKGDTLQVTDGDGHTFVVAAGESDSDGIMFQLDGEDPAHILGVSSLAQSATLGGDLGVLTAINGQSFGVKEVAKSYGGDGQFSVVGAEGGIGEIVGLGGSVAISDAGSAILATTNDDALITFKDGNQFYVGGISDAKPEVGFVMDESNAVAIVGVSSNEFVMGSGSAFEALEAVNTQDFDVKGASALVVVGNDANDALTAIAVFGGSNVVVSAAASATDVLAADVDQITFGESSTFQIEGESTTFVTFEIDSALNVGAVSYVGAQESVTGDFNDVAAVNGQSFVVVDPDKEIMVVGNDDVDGISKIAKVSDGAMIGNVGGADEVVTDTEGAFFFVGHNDGFVVEGDSSVVFEMVEGAAASVAGITDFATNGESAMVIGNLNGLSINGEGPIDVKGDADEILAYAAEQFEGETVYGLAVAGSSVTVNSAASATFIAAGSDGKYTFAMDKDADPTTYTVGGDSEIVFEVEGNQVVGIYDMEKGASVTGDFSNVVAVEGIAEDGTVEKEDTVQILNDSIVTVVYDDFEVKGLNDGASITSATTFKHAYTDGVADDETLAVYDADGDQFVIAGDSDGVHYLLDTKGNIVGVSGLDVGAVLGGNLGALSSVNGVSFDVKETVAEYGGEEHGDGVYSVVGATDGIAAIGGLGGSVAIKDAGGAFFAVTNDDALITFKDGGQFYVGGSGDVKPEVAFVMNDGNAVAILGVSSNEIVMGSGSAFEGIESVNLKDFDVKGASAVLVVGNEAESGLTGIAVFGGEEVVVSAAASASNVLAVDVDLITFGESSTFFMAAASGVADIDFKLKGMDVVGVSSVSDVEVVVGDFTDVDTVNGKSFDVQNDNLLAVVGNANEDGLTVIDLVSDEAVINDVGGASMVITDEEGTFTFADSGDFDVVGDGSVTFQMDTNAAASVAGITDFAVDGESAAIVVGKLNGISINGEGPIDVKGDADEILAYSAEKYEGETYYGLAVGGSAVTINNAASATIIETGSDGVYTFAMDKDADPATYLVGGDSEVVFEVEGNQVVGIYDMEKGASVTGDFSNVVAVEGIAADGTVEEEGTVQILNDSIVTVVYDDFEVRDLSDGASITSETTFKRAYTDAANLKPLTVTDADGDEFTVFGDADGVMYSLDGTGNIVGVSGLDEGAILNGALGELKSVNGKAFDVKEEVLSYGGLSAGDGEFAIVGASDGIGSIIELGGRVTVTDGGGASKFATNDNIFITSGGDRYIVAALKELSPEQLEGITPSTVPAELIKQIAPYVIESDGVEFVTDGKDVITAVNGLSGNELVATFAQSLVGGDFPINGQNINVKGDIKLIAAQGTNDEDGISALIVGGSSNVVVNKAAGAYGVLALDVDQIAFGSASAFTITSDKDIPGVGFGFSSGVAVDSVALLDNKESVTGYFDDVVQVNGADFDVKDADEIMVVGNASVDAVTKIANVSDGAEIANVAGASQVITDTDGTFTFTNSNQVFEVHEFDDSTTFDMNGNDVANVNLDRGVVISDNSNFANVSVNGALVDIKGDEGNMAIGALSSDGIAIVANLGSTSGVVINSAGGASYIGTNKQGNFTFTNDGRAFNVAGDSQVVFVLDENENVTAVIGANKGTSITGDFTKAVAFAGLSSETATEFTTATVQIANDPDVVVVHDDFEVRNLSNGASISSATTVYKAYTDAANLAPLTVTDADGDEFTVYGDADGVMYSLDGAGEIIAVDGLDEGATLGGAIGQLKSINGKDFDIVEQVNTYHGQTGDGVFSVVGGESASGISKVIGLGGNVSVNNAGGATELVTNDEIVLRANDKRLHIRNDSSVTFGVSGTNDIVSLTEFGGMSNATAILDANSAGINGLEINGKGAVSVVGDGNDKLIFKDENGDATLTGIDNLNDSEGATIYSSAYADKVKTSGDGIYNFGGKQEFLVMGEGEGGNRSADAAKNAVWYDVDNDSVTAISSLNASIAGDFTTAIKVNGEAVQVLGDSGVIVVGTGSVDSAATNVSAIEAVNSGATVVSWGSASHVGVFNDDGTLSNYQFIGADNSAQSFIAVDTTDSIFSFTTDTNKVTGVADLDDGYIILNPNQTNALDVNTADYPAQSLTFASTESITGFNLADRYVVAAAGINGSVSGIIAPSATVYGVDGDSDINVNGKDIFVADDDDQFNVVVHDGTPDYLYDVDGDATVLAESVSVRANSAGTDTNPTKDTYVIGGESYVFDDSKDENDGFTFVTDENGVMNKVASLEGALVINDGEWAGTINSDEFEVIDYPNDVNPPVTVNSGVSGIESVGGLDHKDTVNGDLGAAQVHIPGYGEEGGHYGTTITINGKPYTVVRDVDGVDVTGDTADVITDLDNQASLIGAEGEVTVNGTELEPEEGDVIKGDRSDNSHARIVGDDELIRQATAINHYNHQGYDVDTEATTAAAFNIEDVVGLPTYTGAPTAYLDREDTDSIISGSSTIDFNQPLIVSLWNFADGEFQKDEQVFDMSSYSYTKKVYMNGEGPQAVKFNNAGGNLAVVSDEASGVKQISLGSGGDAVVMDEDYALQNAVYIYGGAGDDSVFVRHNANTYIDFSAGGEDIIVTAGEANARVSIAGYQASTGAAIRVEEYLDVINEKAGTVVDGIQSGMISFSEGTVIVTSDEGRSEVYVGTNGYGGQIVNLMTHVTSGNDYKQAVGFTGADGGIVDGSDFDSPLIMIGNDDNTKTAGSTLYGGSANDSFYGGAQDLIFVGYGNDYVELYDDDTREAAIVDIGAGRTTIEGMNNTLADSTGDILAVDIDPNDATFSLLYNDSLGTLEIESSADGYYALLTDVDTLEGNYTTQYIYDETGEELYSVAIGTVNSTIKVTEDEDLRPNVFFGYQTAIDFRDYTGDAIIDLKGDMHESLIDDDIVIIDDDITTLYAGIGDTALKGDLDDETLYAGKGNTWLYGDGGKNLLVGYDNTNNDKEGQTVFYVLGNEDGAAHTISGFNYVSDNNYTDTKKVTADALEFDLDDNNITRIDISGNDLVFEITDKAGNDTESALLLNAINSDGTGKDFIVSDNVAQVAEDTLVFDQFADYYYATGKNATVEVSGRIEDDVILWLDEDETGKIFEGDIHVIDATNSDATAQLAGNDNDNVIFAGTGETSLWGGEGGNDVLVGNAGGRDTFYYSFGNGDDTITNVKDGDLVALDVSLDQIDEIDMSDATAIRIIMNDGDVLTINDAGHSVGIMIDNGEDGTDTYYTDEARSRQ